MKRIVLASIVSLITAVAQADLAGYQNTIAAPTDSGSGPALWYKTSRTPNDGSAGGSYTLTSSGAITNLTADFWGTANSAYGLSAGSNPAAVIGSTGLFATGTVGTVSFMFKTPSTLSGLKSLFNQGYYGLSSQFEVAINNSTLRLATQNGATQPTTNLGTLAPDTWYYYAMTWDLSKPSNDLIWYYGNAGDETLNSGTVTITSAGATSEAIYIGGRKNTSFYTLAGGYFQNVAVYERDLSATAIQSQFDAIPEPGTLGLFMVTGGSLFALRRFITR